MSGDLSEPDRERREQQIHARMAMLPLDSEQGLALFDAACAAAEPAIVPVRLDFGVLRAQARGGMLAPMLRGLVRMPARRAETTGSLARRLADTPAAERGAVVLELVRSQVAVVLGHATADAVDPQRAFKELGFDSLASVELRNRLGKASGLRLPATLVFDHPTPAAVADYLREAVGDGEAAGRPRVEDQLDKLEALVAAVTANGGSQPQVAARLRALDARLQSYLLNGDGDGNGAGGDGEHDLEGASADEIFQIIDEEFGS